jgi:hypothetical protein
MFLAPIRTGASAQRVNDFQVRRGATQLLLRSRRSICVWGPAARPGDAYGCWTESRPRWQQALMLYGTTDMCCCVLCVFLKEMKGYYQVRG